jgi:ATP-dependent Lon protease
MQESAQAALSYIKSRTKELKIKPEIYDQVDIHIHVPEGAVPKDGPSAGITICTALASAFTERKVKSEIGMTGEITLRGRILPVGGVREKVITAYRAGLKTVILPKFNLKDLVDVPKNARKKLNITSVEHMDQVLELALLPMKKQQRKRRTATKAKNNSENLGTKNKESGSVQPGI